MKAGEIQGLEGAPLFPKEKQRLVRDSPAFNSFSIRLDCGGFRELVLLNVVVRERAAVLELLASEDQALLIRRDALLILDLRLR